MRPLGSLSLSLAGGACQKPARASNPFQPHGSSSFWLCIFLSHHHPPLVSQPPSFPGLEGSCGVGVPGPQASPLTVPRGFISHLVHTFRTLLAPLRVRHLLPRVARQPGGQPWCEGAATVLLFLCSAEVSCAGNFTG